MTENEEKNNKNIINIPGFDVQKAIANSGSEEMYKELLGDVYKIIDEKTSLIEKYMNNNELESFTVQVHALKTICRMMGAYDLGEEFYTLEKLGKEKDSEQIQNLAPNTLSAFKSLKPYLEPYVCKNDSPKSTFDKAEVSSLLTKLIAAIDDFDLTSAESLIKALTSISYDPPLSAQIASLENLVSNLDYDEAKSLASTILQKL